MNAEKFKELYEESRNGANCFYRHWATRNFEYSDGVKEVADEGCHWLLDIFATEVPMVMVKLKEGLTVVTARVRKGHCDLDATGAGDRIVYRRTGIHTDLPDGEWSFYLAREPHRFALILPSEY